ncbi:hypothetical protein B6E66_02335 [Streptomyces maremycinicus]|nr:hypothetical protein B6E66_02335 [Streptomyces sp. B9173]
MSDQHAATALTAAAVIVTILVARAAVLHQGSRGQAARPVRPPHRHTASGVGKGANAPCAAALSDGADSLAVQEAEQHVHHYWQQLQAHADPPTE